MERMIGRSATRSQRVFPPIEANLYEAVAKGAGLTGDQCLARKLLDLGNRDLSLWERFRNNHRESTVRLARWLFHHRKALTEELAGQPERADFFWYEFYQDLPSLWRESSVWQEVSHTLSRELGLAETGDPAALQRRLMEEVLIDVHCGFYNGYLRDCKEIGPDSRAFVHFDYLLNLLDYAALSGDELRRLIGPAANLRVNTFRAAQAWDAAIKAAQLLTKHFPESIDDENQLARLHFEATLTKLSNREAARAQRRDADVALNGIRQLEQMMVSSPENATFYELIACLYHVRAIKLSNGRNLAEALEAIEKAVTYYPLNSAAHAARNQLIEAMGSLQAQMKEVIAQLAGKYNVRLNAEGLRLVREAQRGFGLMTNFAESEQAKLVYERFCVAHARQLWRAIGLSVPAGQPEDGWNQRALGLLKAVTQVISNPPATAAGIAQRWQELKLADAALAQLDDRSVCAFLEHSVFRPDEEFTSQTHSDSPPPVAPPVLTTPLLVQILRGEPFGYWLFSRQGRGIKVLAAVAIILVCLATGLWMRETQHRRARDAAFGQLMEASEQGDFPRVIDNAVSFLSHPPLGHDDSRQNEVRGYYQEALVRWAITLRDADNPALAARLERYRQLVPGN
jgi:hypothetical protein